MMWNVWGVFIAETAISLEGGAVSTDRLHVETSAIRKKYENILSFRGWENTLGRASVIPTLP
jgi:hypothetical protein